MTVPLTEPTPSVTITRSLLFPGAMPSWLAALATKTIVALPLRVNVPPVGTVIVTWPFAVARFGWMRAPFVKVTVPIVSVPVPVPRLFMKSVAPFRLIGVPSNQRSLFPAVTLFSKRNVEPGCRTTVLLFAVAPALMKLPLAFSARRTPKASTWPLPSGVFAEPVLKRTSLPRAMVRPPLKSLLLFRNRTPVPFAASEPAMTLFAPVSTLLATVAGARVRIEAAASFAARR